MNNNKKTKTVVVWLSPDSYIIRKVHKDNRIQKKIKKFIKEREEEFGIVYDRQIENEFIFC